MPGQVDEIKARLDIVDVIGEYVVLKQAGTNWKAPCPFHQEKTPSFMASRDKQIWHCFGCGEGGDVFSFIQKIENIEFSEALRLLAKKAGVTLVSQNPQLTSQKNRLLDLLQLATNFWHHLLTEAPQGARGRDYLKQRGVSDATVAEFKLGYAPDSWDVLSRFLRQRGYTEQEIFLAGLTVKKERGVGFYDRFRDRLIFPINDPHGHPIGCSARTLKSDATQAKYLNTPQTPVYNKSLVLFNLDRAKQAIRQQDLAIVVEGQMDAVAVSQAGTKNVVAVSGTAFTTEQLTLLKRYTSNITIAFDTDVAGENASRRGIDLALRNDMNVRIISLPQGKDPDECIRTNPDDWHAALTKTQSVMDYYLEQVRSRFDLTSAVGKKQAAAALLNVISKISSKIEQTHWLQRVSDLLQVPDQILREALPSSSSSSAVSSSDSAKPQPAAAKSQYARRSECLVAICLKFPVTIGAAAERLAPELILDPTLSALYRAVVTYYTEDSGSFGDRFDYQHFCQKINDKNLTSLADQLVLLAEKDFFDFSSEAIRKELLDLIILMKRDHLSGQLRSLEGALKQAERDHDQDKMDELSQSVTEVIHQLNFLR